MTLIYCCREECTHNSIETSFPGKCTLRGPSVDEYITLDKRGRCITFKESCKHTSKCTKCGESIAI